MRIFLTFLAGISLLSCVVAAAGPLTLVKGGTLITLKTGEKPFVGYMTVGPDGRIISVAAGDPPAALKADVTIDAAGTLIAPGFVSAHSHLGNAQFRGLGSTETLYGWSQATTRFHQFTTAEDTYWFCLLGTHEFLRNGITTVFDFTRARPAGADSPADDGYEFNPLKAKIDGGIRFINAIPLATAGSKEKILSRLKSYLERSKAQYGDNPLFLKSALSGGGHRITSKESVELEVAAMRTYGLMNQSHYLESPDGVAEQQAKFKWYVDAGALDRNFIFGHFIHTTPAMVESAARAGATMSWQPLSNGRLASGIADIVAYRAAGMKVAMGLDSNACTDTCDPFENMRVGLSLIRASRQSAKALSVEDVLRMHTLGAAEILGIADQTGSLEPGKFADFLLVDPRVPNTGPVHDPVAHYVLACGLRNLRQIYVGGKLTVDGITLVAQDEAKVRAEVDARVAIIVAKADAADRAR